MDTSPTSYPDPRTARANDNSGCVSTVFVFLMLAWTVTLSVVVLSVTWFMEQAIFMGPRDARDYRWLLSLAYALAVLIPALMVWALGQALPSRRYFKALLLAGLFALCLVPARLAGISAGLETAALQVAGAALFLLISWPVVRRSARPAAGGRYLGLALLLGGLLGIPWVLWGALGSLWDILLNLLAALLFGISAARIAGVVRGSVTAPARADNFVMTLLLDGLMLSLALLVMCVGLGVNGNQGLLVLAVPVLAWVMVSIDDGMQGADGRPAISRRAVALLAGLAAFWPLAFVDPDELAPIISLGIGELIQWANLAAMVGLAIGVAAALLVLITRAGERGMPSLAGRPVLALAGLAWLAALGLYVGLGQPGLHGERLFVILKSQADLSAQAQIGDYQQRRAAVYQALVQHADQTQAGLRQQLDSYRIPYQPYYLENALEVQGGPLVQWWLERQPEVERVLASPVLRPLPAPVPVSSGAGSPPVATPWNLQMIGADRVWSELGVNGRGVIVGQSDSGAQGDHPELANSYLGRDGSHDYRWFDPWYHSPAPVDIGGHGTHTLGSILGDRVGVAPGADWIGCVNLARNLGNPALYLDCMQFMLAPFPQNGDPLRDGRPELGAMVLNNSWGCPPVEGCDASALLPAVRALRAAGIFVVASAGNNGDQGCGSVADPLSLHDPVYSVGALDSSGNLAGFSSIGPVEVDGSLRIKPDIAAPGQEILSSYPNGTYSTASGTSMAGPHVAGVVALMWSANPNLIGDIERTEQIMNETAAPYSGWLPECVAPGQPNNAVGYGIVDAYEAVKRALEE